MYTQIKKIDGTINPDMIKKDIDSSFIPADEGNIDWQQYLIFIAGGGIPNPPSA